MFRSRYSISKYRKPKNVFRYMLQQITKDTEIDFIFTGLLRLLSSVHQAEQTYLPNSMRSVAFYQEAVGAGFSFKAVAQAHFCCDDFLPTRVEALVLLWHALTVNPSFTKRAGALSQIFMDEPNAFLSTKALAPPQLNASPWNVTFFDLPICLLHTASFVLLVLSSERSFAVRLNEPCAERATDALVAVQVSPYIKSFCLESCLKLLSLAERLGRPGYIFRTAFTHHSLVFLVEMLNNLVQYQYEGNVMMVYAILRQSQVFQKIGTLSIGDAKKKSEDRALFGAKAEDAEEGSESKAKWVPTEEWLEGVKKKLPLQTLLCLIEHLNPQLEALCVEKDVTDQAEVLSYLKSTTLVGILPVPHPIVIRTYQASTYTSMWFTSYMWGVIFTRSQRMPLYDWKKIRLVQINQ
ncbi:unnamed protein product [Effrenium voratum]|nr:unnamed protein product [Effrenium voratum]